MVTVQKRQHRLRGYNLLADFITGVKFRDDFKHD
jgi:putative transposase